jgi:regulator of replication initiation timing
MDELNFKKCANKDCCVKPLKDFYQDRGVPKNLCKICYAKRQEETRRKKILDAQKEIKVSCEPKESDIDLKQESKNNKVDKSQDSLDTSDKYDIRDRIDKMQDSLDTDAAQKRNIFADLQSLNAKVNKLTFDNNTLRDENKALSTKLDEFNRFILALIIKTNLTDKEIDDAYDTAEKIDNDVKTK